ncbi:MAG: efflux RND transporter periplasmic adaptor subunit [Gemmatimonadaceae bacterium]
MRVLFGGSMWRGTALAVFLIGTGCGKGGEGEMKREDGGQALEPDAITLSRAQIQLGGISWERVGTRPIAAVLELPGELAPNEDRTARLGASSQGRVLAVHVRSGDRVSRGAPLVTLQSQEASMAQADLAKARAEVGSRRAAATYARAARERAERLEALKAIPRQDVERAVADHELAQASLSQAEAELRRSQQAAAQLGVGASSGSAVIRAPLAGIVMSRDAVPGAVVEPGAPLISLTDPSTLWLAIAVPERHAMLFRVGTKIRFVAVTMPADTQSASVQSVAGALEPTTRTLPVRALVSNAGGNLRPQTAATVWLEGGVRNALAVPEAAVQRLGEQTVVFVAIPDDKGGARFEKRQVEVGAVGDGMSEILTGLAIGEFVVATGAHAVKSEFARATMPDMEM